jgi:hypothetical protein
MWKYQHLPFGWPSLGLNLGEKIQNSNEFVFVLVVFCAKHKKVVARDFFFLWFYKFKIG